MYRIIHVHLHFKTMWVSQGGQKDTCLGLQTEGFIGKIFIVLGTSLVDVYVKCRKLLEAQEAVSELPAWNVTSWTTLMPWFAQHGEAREGFGVFSKMIAERISLNVISFIILFSACIYAGLVEGGKEDFMIWTKPIGSLPNVEHYTCVMNLFIRMGILESAVAVIDQVPSSDRLPLWLAVIGCLPMAKCGIGQIHI